MTLVMEGMVVMEIVVVMMVEVRMMLLMRVVMVMMVMVKSVVKGWEKNENCSMCLVGMKNAIANQEDGVAVSWEVKESYHLT